MELAFHAKLARLRRKTDGLLQLECQQSTPLKQWLLSISTRKLTLIWCTTSTWWKTKEKPSAFFDVLSPTQEDL